MNYIALYRKWRPMTFEDVVEQESVVTILKNSIKNQRVAHAYLFCGTRGTGKTSIAKIFSRAINCTSPVDGSPCNQCDICKGILNDSILDVVEIDAASNNGVDSIRAIIDESNYQSAKAKYKVFIIDEVHMLSTAAFNALLKTLEEPPENVVFILATTEPHKLPVTILSRCQRYDFKRISRDGIVSRLEKICQSMSIDYDESALAFIAGKADGALRDAISLLDQTIATANNEKITLDVARRSTGAIDRSVLESFASAILNRESFAVITLVDKIFSEGADPSNFICELIELMREMLVVLSTRTPEKLIYDTGDDLERIKKLAELTNTKELAMIIKELSGIENQLKWSVQRKIIFEAGMLSLCDRSWGRDTEVTDRILTLERNVADLVATGLKTAYSGGFQYEQPKVSETEKQINDEPDNSVLFEEPAVMPSASELRPVDSHDWNDFISNLQEAGKPAVASVLDANAVGYQIGRVLYLPCKNERLISKNNSAELEKILNESASRAFGKNLRVILESEENFATRIDGLAEAQKNGTETEEDKRIREAEEKLRSIVENSDDNFAGEAFTEVAPQTESDKPNETRTDNNDFDDNDTEEFIDDIDFPDEEG